MAPIELSLTALDCPDPIALANFYASLLGLDVEPLNDFPPEDVTWIELQNDGAGARLPEDPPLRRPHLARRSRTSATAPGLHSDDLDEDEAHALAVGARKADFQPGDTFRVFLDPVGHPFCLVLRQEPARSDPRSRRRTSRFGKAPRLRIDWHFASRGLPREHRGPVVQLGVHAALSRRRSRVQIPSGPLDTPWGDEEVE